MGRPGATEVELSHLKQPESVVGPFMVRHDHKRGHSTRAETEDALILRLVRQTGWQGTTEAEIVSSVCGIGVRAQDFDNARKRIHRRLLNYQEVGLVICIPGQRGGSGGSSPARWIAKTDK